MANNVLNTEMKLTDAFMAQYHGRQPKWGFNGLGYVVYLRTYARTKADGTLETWSETVQRITEGNYEIEAKRLAELGKFTAERRAKLVEEMERFYYLVFNLIIMPPGRGLWMSGTDYAKNVGDAENNCWNVAMRPQAYEGDAYKSASLPAVFMFDQSMKGGGVGVNIQRKNVYQMPEVQRNVEVVFVADPDKEDFDKLEKHGVQTNAFGFAANDTGYFNVPDSRQGWAEALRYVIDAHYVDDNEKLPGVYVKQSKPISRLIVDVSDIRPEGAAIKGFGGTASGAGPLVDMLKIVNQFLNESVGAQVTPTRWGDIIQNIGKCVVAGNVRRTAIILVGDKDEQQFIESKNYTLPENATASQWRWASNNSVDISVDTSRQELRNLAVNIFHNGEPGYVNIELSKHYGRIIDGYQENIDEDVEGFNPCGEITLPNGSPCNLFEVNLPKIHQMIDAGLADESLYHEAMYLAARYAYRITFRPYEWNITREIVEKHRRLGVGITGITDWALLAFDGKPIDGFDDNGDPIYNEAMASKLDELYGYVREANAEQAEELEAVESIKVTTVKPSGTVSILMGVSPGQHYHWSAYMIRRVRISANSPLVSALMNAGYPVEPSNVGTDENGDVVWDYNTLVVSFPVRAATADHPQFQSAGDVPLREQAALQAMLASYWSDNAVSATLSFHKPEAKPVYKDGKQLMDKFGNPVLEADRDEVNAVIEEITDVLDRYKGVIKSTSMLPHMVGTFPQMPYEAVSKETYERMLSRITKNVWELMGDSVAAFEDDTEDNSLECVGENCPIK